MSNWSLQVTGGPTKTFDAWGFSHLRCKFVSQDLDEATFLADGPNYDANQAIASGAQVIITNPKGNIWFAGVVTATPRAGAPDRESIMYRVAGPWWYLQMLTFQQQWTFLNSINPTVTAANYIPDLLMNVNLAGVKVSTKIQIQAIIQFAIAAGAQMKLGQVTTDVQVPTREIKAVTCAQALREQLRFLPDAIIYFDYSTTPPTFNCIRASEAKPRNYDTLYFSTVEAIDIRSREDLQVPAVVIHYLSTQEVDGKTYSNRVVDAYPLTATGLEFGALVSSIDLRGAKITHTKCTVLMEDFSAWTTFDGFGALNLTNVVASLRARFHWLDGRYVNLKPDTLPTWLDPTVTPPAVLPIPNFANIITDGSVPDWFPYQLKLVRMKVDLIYDKYDRLIANPDASPLVIPATAARTDSQYRHPITIDLLLTDAPLGWQTFSQVESIDPAEPTPIGLAYYLYQWYSTLHFDGQITFSEDEVSVSGLGTSVNITSRQEWRAMNTPVQIVEQDIDAGRTTLRFGFQNHLGAQDLVEWLRGLRPIQRTISLKEKSDAITVTDGEITLPKYRSRSEVGEGLGHGNEKVVIQNDGGIDNFVRLAASNGVGMGRIELGGGGSLDFLNIAGPPPNNVLSRIGNDHLEIYDKASAGKDITVRLRRWLTGGRFELLDKVSGGYIIADTALVGPAAIISIQNITEAPLKQAINLELFKCVDNTGKHLIVQLREVDVCVNVGGTPTIQKMICLCSPPYPALS